MARNEFGLSQEFVVLIRWFLFIRCTTLCVLAPLRLGWIDGHPFSCDKTEMLRRLSINKEDLQTKLIY
jgi:hypothetical protein